MGVLGRKFDKMRYFSMVLGYFDRFFGDFDEFLYTFLGLERVGITGVAEKIVEREFGEITVFGDIRL